MIDHTGHPHPSTPKARALCRANGGTGFIGKIGGDAPVAKKTDHDKKRHIPQGPVNTKPESPKPPTGPPVKKGPTVTKDHGEPKKVTPEVKKPVVKAPEAKPLGERSITPKNFDKTKMQIKDGNGQWRDVAEFTKAPGGGSRSAGARGGQYAFKDANGNLIRQASPNERITVRDKPVAPPPTNFLPVPGERRISPTDFDADTMEVRGIDGTWKEVGSISTGQSARGGTVVFKDKNSKLIAAVPRTDTISVRTKQGSGGKIPNRHLMPGYIPPATSSGGLEKARIQNALRNGASREFIVSKSKLTPEQTDAEIDRLLVQYGVPNHVYPRKGGGGKAPDIKSVKSTPANKVLEPDTVDTPSGIASPTLRSVKSKVTAKGRVKDSANRVLSIQETHVGNKISRIRSVDSELPKVNTPEGDKRGIKAGTLAICTHDGKIHLHENLEYKDDLVNQLMASGWFTKGGAGHEQTLAHEMGHALLTDHKMSARDRKELVDTLVQTLGLTNPWGVSPNITYHYTQMDKIVTHPNNKAKIKRAISKYGATNANELIAEVWAEYTMNPKPRPKVKKIGDVIKGIIERGN